MFLKDTCPSIYRLNIKKLDKQLGINSDMLIKP